MSIVVDSGRCIGAGNCVDVAPDYFDQSDDDGTVLLLKAAVEASDEEAVEEAIEACPVRAILVDQSTGR